MTRTRIDPAQKATTAGPSTRSAARRRAVDSPGAPLPADVRHTFEARFGHDFASVRVHADSRAARAAGAVAYTAGDHVVVDTAHDAPTTARGQRLLAHELAHVVQQRFATG